MADLKAAGLGPRRPDRVQYTAPSETGEATVVGGGGADEFAGVGRNAMCPCGSGKKYKRCHGDPRLRN
jgi:preprotein translocase subunit SecA